MKKFAFVATGLALVALLAFTVFNYAQISNMIDKNTKTWEERYEGAIAKLEEKSKNYRRQIFELKVEVKKDEYKNKELQKQLDKAENILTSFYSKLEEVNDGKFEFRGKVYEGQGADNQKQKWLLEYHAMELEAKTSAKMLEKKKAAIEKLEKVHLQLQKRIAVLRAQGQELATKKKIKELQAKLRQVEMSDTNVTVGDENLDEINTLIGEANEEIRDLQAREAVQEEMLKNKKLASDNNESLKEISTVNEEDAKVSIQQLDARFKKSAKK